MTNKDFSKIDLNDEDMLIQVTDVKEDKKNWKPAENTTYEIAEIVHVGKNLPENWKNGIVMFHMNLSTPIEIPGYGKYNVLPNSSKLVVIRK